MPFAKKQELLQQTIQFPKEKINTTFRPSQMHYCIEQLAYLEEQSVLHSTTMFEMPVFSKRLMEVPHAEWEVL
jgi:hypothetical protein